MSFSNVGSVWTAQSLKEYLKSQPQPTWCSKICLHHTAEPSLKQRPAGFTAQHIVNIKDFYQSLGWRSGPHLFIDEDQAWGMTPFNGPGVHAISFNSSAIGIEVLGDYDDEDPKSGRGLQCWTNAANIVRVLFDWMGIKTATKSNLLFHRDDPKTSKTCPGTKVQKDWVLSLINGSAPSTPLPVIEKSDTMPVIEFAVKQKNYTNTEALSLLKQHDGMFYFGNVWLEGAKYDKIKECTVAPLKDLNQISKKS